jgi:hypothetical protein
VSSTNHDNPNLGPTAIVAFVFTLIVVVTVVGLQAYFFRAQTEELDTKVVERAPENRERVRTEQEVELSTYRWIDRNAGTVAIPIERAMDLVAAELASQESPGAP